tara:strand:- start:1323 stop:1799 length:477 start_codon:yes stop_codon:yes gene_type:complete
MSITQKIKNLNLAEDAVVTLSYSEGTDVFVHNETEIETALSDTDVVTTFASLVATPGLNVLMKSGGNVLESLRSKGHLDDYERGSDGFEDYIGEFLTENFYDQEFIEYSTERYDHKRGFCTLSAQVQVSASEIISKSPYLSGWEVSVVTDNGTLTIEA